jgi:hypothetical protein
MRDEFLGALKEVGPLGVRLRVIACASNFKGEPVGEPVEVGSSPWFPREAFASASWLWYCDLYRERSGFVHPEDPRGDGTTPEGVSIFVFSDAAPPSAVEVPDSCH